MKHLKELLANHGISQTRLANILGRDKSVVTNLFQGKRQLKADEAALIASHLGVTVAEVMGLAEKEATGFAEHSILIPFQHEPMASKKQPGVVQKGGKFFLETQKSNFTDKAYALEMRDDSMNLGGILPGDILISELDKPFKPGQLVVAQHYQKGNATTIIRKYEPPFLMPHSTSQSFKPLQLERDDVRIVSPVLKLIRAF